MAFFKDSSLPPFAMSGGSNERSDPNSQPVDGLEVYWRLTGGLLDIHWALTGVLLGSYWGLTE